MPLKSLSVLLVAAYVARAAPVAESPLPFSTVSPMPTASPPFGFFSPMPHAPSTTVAGPFGTFSPMPHPPATPTAPGPFGTFASMPSPHVKSIADEDAYGAEAVFVYPSQAAAASSSPSTQRQQRPLVMAYYPDWTSSEFPPEDIDFSLFDWIDFAFALPDQNFNLTWDDPEGTPAVLARLVELAHKNSKKVKLSIGGWTGSRHFSDAVATNDSRQLFTENIAIAYDKYDLDGIDIDWEYPGHQGDSGNIVSPADTDNFIHFLRALRETLPADAVLTAATQPAPFIGQDGQPLRNVTDFADILDWILIMNYDVWSSSLTPGPNAPFYDACHNSTQPEANAVGAFNAWNAAGLPASKMVLGIPSYGYVSTSNATRLRSRSQASVRVVSDENKPEGQVTFRNLVAQNVLARNETDGAFIASGGFIREWDECSSTPFLRSPDVQQVISYDDTESLALKAAFVDRVGMLGVNMWDVHGDTDDCDLVKSVREALGYETAGSGN